MTTANPAIIRPDIVDARQVDFFERLTPKQGWDSFLFLLIAVGVVAYTVREAEWVQTPGLFTIVSCPTSRGWSWRK